MWVAWPPAGPKQEENPDQDHEEREKLSPGKRSGQRCIGFPEAFAQESHNGVGDEENAGQDTIGESYPSPEHPEERKKEQTLQSGLHKLRGVARSDLDGQQFTKRLRSGHPGNHRLGVSKRGIDGCSLGKESVKMLRRVDEDLLRKLDGPKCISHTAEEFPVDEVGASPEKDSDRAYHHEIVGEIPERKSVSLRVPNCVKSQAKNASMAGHASLPDTKKNQGVMEEPVGIIKEHVAETPSQKHAKESAHRDEIRNLIGPQIGISTLRKMLIKQDADDESG